MLAIALDTATATVAVGLVRLSPDSAPELLAERITPDARRHGELLSPGVRAVLAEAGHAPADLGAVVAGVGPGPFTGLRVGLVTAAALSDALGVPAYGVGSLEAIAGGPGRLLVATDARRREVYWAVQADGVLVAGPDVSRPADLAARLPELGATAMAGPGAALYAGVLGLPLRPGDHPRPLALAARAADRALAGAPAEPLTPLYLRRPDAVPPGEPKRVTA